LLTPEVGGLPNSTVNSNATVGGVGSGNSIGAGESIRLDFVNNLTGNTAKSVAGDYGAVPNEDHSFTGHYTVNGAQATFSSTTGSKVSFVAADDVNLDPNGAPGNSVGPNEGNTGFTLDSVTQVLINYNGGSQLIDVTGFTLGSNHDFTIGGHLFTVSTFNAGGGVIGVNVDHVIGDNIASPGAIATSIAAFTATGYNSLE